ncbi:class I SAM-dependent methyltransferase [[Limnothrix rosea] IAM M-220]|uniref:class I SAM-dependent methyltransferase n=1 Tax=[Limnothrix rosea] IAM M-220 TaxID=454133 RepID=UPI00096083BA|nr:class I SAM-dependent methyltransferase [[Limnothrix rosea] IAM M-220]OKH19910.1 SAM-dependent methyltransferase [[Limnothrix rosea] IAM M-220]
MTASTPTKETDFRSKLVNRILSVRPLADFAKNRARHMMITRAEKLGVPWRKTVAELQQRNWQPDLEKITNSNLKYPDYYTTSFHAYDEGNLGWEPALEVECASKAVHSTLFGEPTIEGDRLLRESYHNILKAQLPEAPETIVDIGCGAGLSTEALQELFPDAQVTGVDLSPYFLAVASYRTAQAEKQLTWLHAAGEATTLPDNSVDLVSCSLVFHELPQSAAIAIFREAKRILKPGGHFAMMDMNPQAEVYRTMKPYILTLLKSTEPYLDQYFALDVGTELVKAGFNAPYLEENTARHRTVIAQVKG